MVCFSFAHSALDAGYHSLLFSCLSECIWGMNLPAVLDQYMRVKSCRSKHLWPYSTVLWSCTLHALFSCGPPSPPPPPATAYRVYLFRRRCIVLEGIGYTPPAEPERHHRRRIGEKKNRNTGRKRGGCNSVRIDSYEVRFVSLLLIKK